MFYNDLEQAATYISVHLGSPQAAAALIDDVEKAVLDRLPYAESFEVYPSLNKEAVPLFIRTHTPSAF